MSTVEGTVDRSALKERLRFEELLAELSSAFLAAEADEIDGQIHAALRRLGEFLRLDRVGVIEALDAGNIWRPIFWQGPRVARDEELGPVPADETFPWLAENTRRRRPIAISSLDDVPAEGEKTRSYCEKIGIRAFLMMPFEVGSSVAGSVFCDSATERAWPEDFVNRVKRLTEIFANALTRQHADREIVGESEVLRAVLRQAEQVAPTGSTVLILGETGTGKELLARAIHRSSPRRERAMIKINCAALPATLVEGELFGREKGAYTGASTSRAGRFEAADGSTLFLDEIGELEPEVQVRLLRVLEDGELERLGSNRTRTVDVRLIAAGSPPGGRVPPGGRAGDRQPSEENSGPPRGMRYNGPLRSYA